MIFVEIVVTETEREIIAARVRGGPVCRIRGHLRKMKLRFHSPPKVKAAGTILLPLRSSLPKTGGS